METPHIPVFTFDENKKLEWKDIYQKVAQYIFIM